jgi:hypothetical protein
MPYPNAMTADRDAIVDRRDKIWALRISGMTYKQIQKELHIDCAIISQDIQVVRNELRANASARAQEEREHDLSVIAIFEKKILTALQVTDNPKEIGQLTLAFKGLQERRSKLMGLEIPTVTQTETMDDNGKVKTTWQATVQAMGWIPPEAAENQIMPGLPAPGEEQPEVTKEGLDGEGAEQEEGAEQQEVYPSVHTAPTRVNNPISSPNTPIVVIVDD